MKTLQTAFPGRRKGPPEALAAAYPRGGRIPAARHGVCAGGGSPRGQGLHESREAGTSFFLPIRIRMKWSMLWQMGRSGDKRVAARQRLRGGEESGGTDGK